jgi:hypothetical protein
LKKRTKKLLIVAGGMRAQRLNRMLPKRIKVFGAFFQKRTTSFVP